MEMQRTGTGSSETYLFPSCTVAPGGGPGKPTLVSLEVVQTFGRSEGSWVPDEAEVMEWSERLERAERSMDMHRELETRAGQCLPQVKEQLSNYFAVAEGGTHTPG